MRIDSVKKNVMVLAAIAAVLLLSSAPAHACATCYTAYMGAKAVQALKNGILILLIPTLAIFGGLLFFTFRHQSASQSWPARAQAPEPEPLTEYGYQEDTTPSRF